MRSFYRFFLERGWISLVALAASLIFCFVIFPHLTSRAFLPYDIDGHGSLGQGIYQCGTLSFYPSCDPTVQRAPIYPIIVWGLIWLNPSWYPASVVAFQCFIFAATIQLVFSIVLFFASLRRAQMISLACAVHPYLIWFASRIWIELVIVFFFTAVVYSLLYYSKNPSFKTAAGLGLLLGIACLTKQTFLPYILMIPIGLYLLNYRNGQAFLVFLIPLLVIAPWTLRNWNLTHQFIPVQTLVGYNMRIGDYLVENSPSKEWWPLAYKANLEPIEQEGKVKLGDNAPSWKRELFIEKKALLESLKQYWNHPAFFFKKLAINAWSFWFMGGINTYYLPWFYIFFLILQAAVLLFFIDASWRIYRDQGFRNIHTLAIVLVWLYFLAHLPVLSESRFSLPLIPTMMAYGFGWPFKK